MSRSVKITAFFMLFISCIKQGTENGLGLTLTVGNYVSGKEVGLNPGNYLSRDSVVAGSVYMHVYDTTGGSLIFNQQVIKSYLARKNITSFSFDNSYILKNPDLAVNYIDTNHLTITDKTLPVPVEAFLQAGGVRSTLNFSLVPIYVFAQSIVPLPPGSLATDVCYANNAFFSHTLTADLNNDSYKVFVIASANADLSVSLVTSYFSKAGSSCSSLIEDSWGFDMAIANAGSKSGRPIDHIQPGDTLVIQTKTAILRKK